MRYEWIVVIIREPDIERDIVMFHDESDARDYYDRWGAQWTESYLCKIVEGPKV